MSKSTGSLIPSIPPISSKLPIFILTGRVKAKVLRSIMAEPKFFNLWPWCAVLVSRYFNK